MQTQEIYQLANLFEKSTACLAKWQGKTVVVKYGGNAMLNEALKQSVMRDIYQLNALGIRIVLVHGGGPEISQGVKLLGKEPTFINGLRVTDADTINVVLQMLAGKVNKSLVAMLHGKGIGLCGIDGAMLQCKKLEAEVDYGFVGEITKVNPQLIQLALDSGFIPVISTVGVAEKLVSMTDIAGLLRDRFDESTLISQVTLKEVEALTQAGIIAGGMIPKIACCTEFLQAGGEEASIIDGRVDHAILIELLGSVAHGTRFIP